MRVALGDAAVRRPARVTEPVRRDRAVRPCGRPKVREVADGADVVEPVLLEERKAGGVVTAVLETLEPLQEQRLRFTRPHVSDDSAHPKLLPSAAAGPWILLGDRILPLLPKNAESPAFQPLPASEEVSRALVRRAPRW